MKYFIKNYVLKNQLWETLDKLGGEKWVQVRKGISKDNGRGID